jgi:biopolymer transport protein ExbB
MLLSILLQISEGAVASLPEVPVKEDSLSLFDLIMKGGYLMMPIFVLSLVSIYVMIERWSSIRKLGHVDPTLLSNVKDYIRKGNIDGAKTLCKSQQNAISAMLYKGITRIGKPIREIESSMESVGKLEIAKMERNLSILGIIAGIAPMFGFIGTISGVIKIFYNISLADNISIGLISGGLYEKMITSASGLIVGVFSFVGYHFLTMMIDKRTNQLEAHSIEFIDLLQDNE